MFLRNRLLISLHNAIKLSNSLLPQERQIAVIIFDQLIEVTLYNTVKSIFDWNFPSNNATVKPDSKERKNILYNYDALIKYAKKLDYLDPLDESLLSFTHSIRNEIYHKGAEDVKNTNLALSIYFNFIERRKEFLATTNGLTNMSTDPGYDVIDFGQGGLSTNIIERLTNGAEYFSRAFDFLLQSRCDSERFQDLAYTYFTEAIRNIESDIQYLQSNYRNLNFYSALMTSTFYEIAPFMAEFIQKKRKPRSIDSILLTAGFFRVHEDEINDLSTRRERNSLAKKLFKESRRGLHGKYPHWVNLQRIKTRVEKLKTERIDTAIQNFVNLNKTVELFSLDLGFATMIMSGYEMWLFDYYRDK